MVKKSVKVCWVSAGISSFMAGYLAGDVDEWIYIDIADQHPDSIRFIKDCERVIYELLLACCMDMSLACCLEELNELIRMIDIRLDMLQTFENARSGSRG